MSSSGCSEWLGLVGFIAVIAMVLYCITLPPSWRPQGTMSEWLDVNLRGVRCSQWKEHNLCLCVGVVKNQGTFAFIAPPDVCESKKER